MKRITLLTLCLALTPALAADSTAESSVKLMEQFADVVAASGTDCPKLGKGLDAFVTEHQAALVAMGERNATLTLEQKKAEGAKYKQRLDATTKKTKPVMVACKQDESVRAGMKRFMDAIGANRPPPKK